jgi:hypothetical protein
VSTRSATAAITNFHSNDADNLMMALHHWMLQQMPKRNIFISIANFSIPRNPKDTKKKVKSVHVFTCLQNTSTPLLKKPEGSLVFEC